MTLLLATLGWATVGAGALGIVSLSQSWCPRRGVAVVQLLLPSTLVLCGLIGIVGFGTRVIALACAASACAFSGAAMITHLARPAARCETIGKIGTDVTLVFANMYIDNPVPDEAFEQLLETGADVIVMTELSNRLLDCFDESSGGEYPHRIHRVPLAGEYETGIFSRLPFAGSQIHVDGALRTVEAAVRLPGDRTLSVMTAHPTAPTDATSFREWRNQLERLAGRVRSIDRPIVVVGDMNAARLQVPLEQFLAQSGLRDLHADVGRALCPSWGIVPGLPGWLPTLLARFDHALSSQEVEVRILDDLRPIGSDHRPFRAALTVTSAIADSVT